MIKQLNELMVELGLEVQEKPTDSLGLIKTTILAKDAEIQALKDLVASLEARVIETPEVPAE